MYTCLPCSGGYGLVRQTNGRCLCGAQLPNPGPVPGSHRDSHFIILLPRLILAVKHAYDRSTLSTLPFLRRQKNLISDFHLVNKCRIISGAVSIGCSRRTITLFRLEIKLLQSHRPFSLYLTADKKSYLYDIQYQRNQ